MFSTLAAPFMIIVNIVVWLPFLMTLAFGIYLAVVSNAYTHKVASNIQSHYCFCRH